MLRLVVPVSRKMLLKSRHVASYTRRDPKTGKMVYVPEHSDVRDPAQMELFAAKKPQPKQKEEPTMETKPLGYKEISQKVLRGELTLEQAAQLAPYDDPNFSPPAAEMTAAEATTHWKIHRLKNPRIDYKEISQKVLRGELTLEQAAQLAPYDGPDFTTPPGLLNSGPEAAVYWKVYKLKHPPAPPKVTIPEKEPFRAPDAELREEDEAEQRHFDRWRRKHST